MSSQRLIPAKTASIATKLLYHEQGDLHQHDANITAIEPISLPDGEKATDTNPDSHVIYLDETIFHVQGGGQPYDLGTISTSSDSTPSTFNITSVRHGTNSQVQHTGHFHPAEASNSFLPNTKVHLSLDTERRHLNSRIHSAGHILGVAIMRLSRAGTLPPLVETKAKHYPEDASVEFKGLIAGEFKDAIQTATDELVKEARPLHIRFWDREECERNGVALPEKIEAEKFRAVEIEGCGAYACGGTHVRDTSGVGRIVVRGISRKKGGTRVGYHVEEV